ncbi:MAG: 50S ribosomal protein L30 [Candidatus Woesearchaeota archaeon]|nr:50S ribosomal protein L30 [Candidatus Woesearchaeota archaeon]
MEQKRIAIIRIKGKAGLKKTVKDTFLLLKLYKKNSCVVVPNTPSYVGMLTKVKDCATWGEIDEQTFKLLLEKRGKLPGNKSLTNEYIQQKLKINLDQFVKEFMSFKKELKDIPGIKLFFKLTPPRHGFEDKGIKVQFSQGGVLGYRKDKINDLIQRMS